MSFYNQLDTNARNPRFYQASGDLKKSIPQSYPQVLWIENFAPKHTPNGVKIDFKQPGKFCGLFAKDQFYDKQSRSLFQTE